MMEYENFYKFLEGRPVKELNDCIHHIVDMVGTRFTKFQPKLESIQKAAVEAMVRIRSGYDESLDAEYNRSAAVMKNIICYGIQMPFSMNGFNTKTKRFIRWLTGFSKPVSVKVGLENNLKSDWFLHKELQVWLNWNPEGYFEMSRKDSLKFNESTPSNKHLLDHDSAQRGEKRKVDKELDRDVQHEEQKKAKNQAPRFRYLSSSSEDEQKVPVDRKPGGDAADEGHDLLTPGDTRFGMATTANAGEQPPDQPNTATPGERISGSVISAEEQRAIDLVKRNGVGNIVTPTIAAHISAPAKPPLKGDIVYIISGPYTGKKGTILGQRGTDSEVFKIDINTPSGDHMVVTASTAEISHKNPGGTAALTEEVPSPGAKVVKHRRRVEQPNPPQIAETSPPATPATPATPGTVASASASADEASKMDVQAENEEELDEFFHNLQSEADKDADGPYFKRRTTDAPPVPSTAQALDTGAAPAPEATTTADSIEIASTDLSDHQPMDGQGAGAQDEHDDTYAVLADPGDHVGDDAPSMVPAELRAAFEQAMQAISQAEDMKNVAAEAQSSPSKQQASAVQPTTPPPVTTTALPRVVSPAPARGDKPQQVQSKQLASTSQPESEVDAAPSSTDTSALAGQVGTPAATELTTRVDPKDGGATSQPSQAITELISDQPVVAASDKSTETAAAATPILGASPLNTSTVHIVDEAAKAEKVKQKKEKRHREKKDKTPVQPAVQTATTLQAGTQVRVLMGQFKGQLAVVLGEATGAGGLPAMEGVYKVRVMNDRSSQTVMAEEFLQVVKPQPSADGTQQQPAPALSSEQATSPVLGSSVNRNAYPDWSVLVAQMTDEAVAEASIWN